MIRFHFNRTLKDEEGDKASVAFADYCRGELERRRDSGAGCDEELFNAAVDLAVGRLRAMEEGEGKA